MPVWLLSMMRPLLYLIGLVRQRLPQLVEGSKLDSLQLVAPRMRS